MRKPIQTYNGDPIETAWNYDDECHKHCYHYDCYYYCNDYCCDCKCYYRNKLGLGQGCAWHALDISTDACIGACKGRGAATGSWILAISKKWLGAVRGSRLLNNEARYSP